jgi:hypothetical protein
MRCSVCFRPIEGPLGTVHRICSLCIASPREALRLSMVAGVLLLVRWAPLVLLVALLLALVWPEAPQPWRRGVR